jgi:hypothetical protein
MLLGEYIRGAIARPWEWGEVDCCTFAADWAVLCGRADPMGFIRGCYHTELGALRKIKKGGGLVALWTRGMAEAGIPEADSPHAGDIGVIARATDCRTNEAAAIYAGERWVTLGARGIDSGPADVLALWRP